MRSSNEGSPPDAPSKHGPRSPRPGPGRTVSREERETRRYLWRVVAGLRVRQRDVDDIVQETMIAAARAGHRFRVPEGGDPTEARLAWLRGIAQRCVAQAYRVRARHGDLDFRADVPSGDWHGPGSAPSAEAVTLARADITALRARLAALRQSAPELHAIVVAHALEERPMREVAATLGIGVHTAWNWLRRGKAALRAPAEPSAPGRAGERQGTTMATTKDQEDGDEILR